MHLHSCTVVLKSDLSMTCDNVEQTLGIIDQHGPTNIDKILIDAFDGQSIRRYHELTIEESIESLMSL
ncbi:hypothetical protein [Vibrio sinaloensis]|uniref:hypothetical protein n=1 Tax=Photobacterium sp. (strain ATCC 43367) TaxID=379097 RepID=UPI0022AFB109|nr:hypothetical protein [Vibrio sinaloensis]MCZ4292901.1 hypothetical protein [Vibrio sinaloensis]